MTDIAAATRELLMRTAGPTLDHDTLETLIRDTYTTRAAAHHLALQTAEAIAAKLDTTPLALRLNTAAQQHAYLLVTAAADHDPDAGELLDGITTVHLADVCIALLGMWRGACGAAAAVALGTAGGTEEALDGLLRAQGAENSGPGAVDAPNPADGRTA